MRLASLSVQTDPLASPRITLSVVETFPDALVALTPQERVRTTELASPRAVLPLSAEVVIVEEVTMTGVASLKEALLPLVEVVIAALLVVMMIDLASLRVARLPSLVVAMRPVATRMMEETVVLASVSAATMFAVTAVEATVAAVVAAVASVAATDLPVDKTTTKAATVALALEVSGATTKLASETFLDLLRNDITDDNTTLLLTPNSNPIRVKTIQKTQNSRYTITSLFKVNNAPIYR